MEQRTEKIFVGNTSYEQGQYGPYFSIGFTREHIETLLANMGPTGWANVYLTQSQGGKWYMNVKPVAAQAAQQPMQHQVAPQAQPQPGFQQQAYAQPAAPAQQYAQPQAPAPQAPAQMPPAPQQAVRENPEAIARAAPRHPAHAIHERTFLRSVARSQ